MATILCDLDGTLLGIEEGALVRGGDGLAECRVSARVSISSTWVSCATMHRH